jgi:ethanolamine utilization microcompartment shell protein EutS
MPVICPVSDGSDLAGIGILVTTPEEADRIMAGDPAVQSGILTYEVHPTRSFPGSRLPD